jgi:hypothetical protein
MRMDTTNPHGPTSRDGIAQFEAHRGVLLPREYKKFLLNSNGGMPTSHIFAVPGFHGQGSSLNSFYGIHNGPKHHQLDWACEVHKERIPDDLIPIASDAFGNEICIGWKGKRRGKIYFWDHEDELDEQGLSRQDYGNVYLVANSLGEFLDNLKESED